MVLEHAIERRARQNESNDNLYQAQKTRLKFGLPSQAKSQSSARMLFCRIEDVFSSVQVPMHILGLCT